MRRSMISLFRRHSGAGRASSLLAAIALFAVSAGSAQAADHVRIAAFQSSGINFPIYVALSLKLFEKHGIEPELIYGKGIQPTNMLLSSAVDFGGIAVEHGITVISKGQDLKLLVLNQTLPPFTLVVRNGVPTPNLNKPYPGMIVDLKGLKLGISTPGAGTDLTLRLILAEGGLDPQQDVRIVPVGEPSTQIAALKNGVIDGTMAFEPIQTELVLGQHVAKSVLDIEGGQGPKIFREYAYNGIFARSAYIVAHPDIAQHMVDTIVEAEQVINDPQRTDEVVDIAVRTMQGIEAKALRAYIEKYRHVYAPSASRRAIANVEEDLKLGHIITQAPPYEAVVATQFMPGAGNAP